MKENDNDLKLDNNYESFGQLNDLSNKNIYKTPLNSNNNENNIKLTTTIIKSEEKRRKLTNEYSQNSNEINEDKISNNICILFFIIFIISLGFVFKKKLIWLKKNVLSNSLSFNFTILISIIIHIY